MIAMRTYAKKKECANATVGPFTMFSHCVYGYNVRNELISAAKLVGRDDPIAPQSPTLTTEYAYQYDDIGNRLTSLDLGTNRTYTANNLNQYLEISTSDVGRQTSVFGPQYDDDMRPRRRRRVARRSEATEPRSGRKRPRNQTLIQTSTGVWSVTYNGENRPILWTCLQSNNQTITNQTIISMTYDRMGRRVTKNDQRFVSALCR